jgi:hypothetical protein
VEKLGAKVGSSGTGTTLLGGRTEEDAGVLAVTMAVTVTAVLTVTVDVKHAELDDTADEKSVLASATLKTANTATRELKTAIGIDCKRVWLRRGDRKSSLKELRLRVSVERSICGRVWEERSEVRAREYLSALASVCLRGTERF